MTAARGACDCRSEVPIGRGGGRESTSTAAASSTATPTRLSAARLPPMRESTPSSARASSGPIAK